MKAKIKFIKSDLMPTYSVLPYAHPRVTLENGEEIELGYNLAHKLSQESPNNIFLILADEKTSYENKEEKRLVAEIKELKQKKVELEKNEPKIMPTTYHQRRKIALDNGHDRAEGLGDAIVTAYLTGKGYK